MNELIKIDVRMDKDQIITDSRNVATVFGKQHNHVLRDIQSLEKDVSNFGQMFYESEMPDSYGRLQKVYLMNRDGFTLLAMGFTGKEAMEWKLKYINAFNAMEAELNSPEQIMARALKIADSTITSLRIENKKLTGKVEQLSVDNERMKPKEIFSDAVTASDSAILVRDLAKMIKQNGVDIGEKRLYRWMRQNGYICQNSRTPTQKAMERGLFEVEVKTVERTGRPPIETITTKVTGKGQIYFINKILTEKPSGQYQLSLA